MVNRGLNRECVTGALVYLVSESQEDEIIMAVSGLVPDILIYVNWHRSSPGLRRNSNKGKNGGRNRSAKKQGTIFFKVSEIRSNRHQSQFS